MPRNTAFFQTLLALAGLAACQAGGDRPAHAAASAVTPSVVGTPRDTIFVEIIEWDITMSRDSIPAGPVIFRITNAAPRPHELEVMNEEEEFDAGEISPGSHFDLRADLDRGTYTLYCPLAGPEGSHARMGQMTTLQVN